ncbi:hypothetical protein Y032_0081g1498 [Ancylostoma ceylanicum]|uniref:Uncharacterized protein n=1 Tax=Ancylostoma ceylanicum TaxID=53326 RepID=A0A016TSC9_9BILA|nr:hypothetical protein Y032_0081g1498 [Ancylostoma ceylanicum]
MAVTHPRPRQGSRATAPHAPESLSSVVEVLFLDAFLPNLVIFPLFFMSHNEKLHNGSKPHRFRRAWRGCAARQGRKWVTAIELFLHQANMPHGRHESANACVSPASSLRLGTSFII